MITIREVTLADFERIYEINESTLGYDYPKEKTKERLQHILAQNTNKLFAACNKAIVIGYIHGADYECAYSDSLKNILAIAVDEQFQGQGAGKKLLQAIENWAKQDGCEGVRLVSGFNREKAHKFYLHCGYTLRKNQKNFNKIF